LQKGFEALNELSSKLRDAINVGIEKDELNQLGAAIIRLKNITKTLKQEQISILTEKEKKDLEEFNNKMLQLQSIDSDTTETDMQIDLKEFISRLKEIDDAEAKKDANLYTIDTLSPDIISYFEGKKEKINKLVNDIGNLLNRIKRNRDIKTEGGFIRKRPNIVINAIKSVAKATMSTNLSKSSKLAAKPIKPKCTKISKSAKLAKPTKSTAKPTKPKPTKLTKSSKLTKTAAKPTKPTTKPSKPTAKPTKSKLTKPTTKPKLKSKPTKPAAKLTKSTISKITSKSNRKNDSSIIKKT
jgi:hypothetical protein